jgi:hypothetical protein
MEKKLWEIRVYDDRNELLTRDYRQSEQQPTGQAERMTRETFSASRYEVNEVQARVKRSEQRWQYWSE